jgi:hypothetical protein
MCVDEICSTTRYYVLFESTKTTMHNKTLCRRNMFDNKILCKYLCCSSRQNNNAQQNYICRRNMFDNKILCVVRVDTMKTYSKHMYRRNMFDNEISNLSFIIRVEIYYHG